MKFTSLILTAGVFAGLSPCARAGETVLIPYTHSWQFMHPMGQNPAQGDPDFDTTWWLAVADFAADYDGPTFGGSDFGNANNPASINTGFGPGPFGYADVDNWNGSYAPLLAPLEGGPPVTTMGTFLTRPVNGNRKASYYRTTFDTSQVLLKPVIRCMMDDGAVIFLDGVQVARVNLTLPTPEEVPTYATYSNADPLPPNHTENTLYTIDLSQPGMQNSSGTLRAEVINSVVSLPPGLHTLAVFTANLNGSNQDMLMALQLTADSGGINPSATNLTRAHMGTPTNPDDDTFEFDVTVNHLSGSGATWLSNSTQHSTGSYGTVYHFSGFPVTGPAQINFTDSIDPTLTSLLTVTAPPAPIWIGQITLPGQAGPLMTSPATEQEWVQAGAETASQNNGGGEPRVLESNVVPIPPAGAVFSAILEIEETSSVNNFEANDSVEAVLILNAGGPGSDEVNLLPASLDRNGDGFLTGFGGPEYNSNIIADELNPAGRTAEATYVEGVALTAVIPPGTVSARLMVRGTNNHTSEIFRVKFARFAAAGTIPDLDRDGISDADELAAGTNPLSAASRFVSTHNKTGNTIAVTFPTVVNRTYRIMSSTDMINWVPENAASIIGDGSVFSINVPASVQRKYLTVQAGRGLNPWQ